MTVLERGQFVRRIAIAVSCALTSLGAVEVQPVKAEETIMVLDASRSMWGTIDKTTKHTMVHDAFANAFKKLATTVPRMGLVTFGNRAPADCSDITIQLGAGNADRAQFLSTVKSIRPWGLTPIAEALKAAALEFTDTNQSNRIVLVVDGLENCRGNPCTMAQELKAQSAGLTIDVVALDVAKTDHPALACIATATDGIFLAAASQTELNKASRSIVQRIAAGVPKPGAETPVAVTPGSEKTTQPLALLRGPVPLPRAHPLARLRKFAQLKPKQKPGANQTDLLLATELPAYATEPGERAAQTVGTTQAMSTVPEPIHIVQNQPEATPLDPTPTAEPVNALSAAPQDDAPGPAKTALPAQTAETPAEIQQASDPSHSAPDMPVETDVPVPPVRTAIAAPATPSDDAPLPSEPAPTVLAKAPATVQPQADPAPGIDVETNLPATPETTAHQDTATQDSTPPLADPLQTAAIPTTGDTAPQATMPEGEVQPLPERPAAPDTSARKSPEASTPRAPSSGHKPEFNIRNQSTPERQGIKLRAKLTAQMRHIGRPVEWTVFKVENVEEALWKQVSAVRASEPSIELPPGTYLVRAHYGHVSASKMIDVVKGKHTDATFVLNAGGLRILSHLVFVDTPNGSRATHFIYTGAADENGMRTLIAKSDIQGEIVRLNAGKYRVISRLGDANSVVSTDVEVNPGVLTAVEINHKAGVLTLKVDDPGGTQSSTTKPNMVVFDKNGILVTRVRGDKATTILAPGRYTVSAERAGKTVTTDIDIRIGEDKAVSLDLQ